MSQKYEWSAAIPEAPGLFPRLVGVSFADSDYTDARTRAMGEVWDIKRDYPETVLVRRTIGEWEQVPADD